MQRTRRYLLLGRWNSGRSTYPGSGRTRSALKTPPWWPEELCSPSSSVCSALRIIQTCGIRPRSSWIILLSYYRRK
ncbi:Uncharacterized protein OBRU01_02621, partial [Operophtera brumata]